MPIRGRRHVAADDGLSLVEVLVAMTLLAVVLAASASTFISSFVAIGANENRTRATALANEELENLRALPWNQVGFYAGDPFPSGMATTYPTVILGDGGARPAGTRAPMPTQVVTGRGPAFTVTRTIEWVDNEQTSSSDPAAPSDQDYKRLAVNVAWTDASGQARTIDVESLRSPTPEEQPTSDFVLSHYDVQPGVVHITDEGVIDPSATHDPPPLQLYALTSAAADFVQVSFQERDGSTTTRSLISPGDGKTWHSSYSSGRFRNGEVVFTFTATRAWPIEQEVIGRRIVRFLQPPRFTAVTLTPAGPTTCLSPEATTPAVQVDAHVNGVVQEDAVTVRWNGQTVQATPTGATPDGTAFTATIPAGSYSETTTVELIATRQQTQTFAADPGQVVVTRQGDASCAS